MNNTRQKPMSSSPPPRSARLLTAAYALTLTLTLASASACGETVDNAGSEVACSDYCDKKYACDDASPSDGEADDCSSDCRTTIENDCGNENQAAANEKIGECVDKSCDEFLPCMVFEPAPKCFDFVNN